MSQLWEVLRNRNRGRGKVGVQTAFARRNVSRNARTTDERSEQENSNFWRGRCWIRHHEAVSKWRSSLIFAQGAQGTHSDNQGLGEPLDIAMWNCRKILSIPGRRELLLEGHVRDNKMRLLAIPLERIRSGCRRISMTSPASVYGILITRLCITMCRA